MENPVSRPLARISGLATDRFGHAVNSEGLLWWLIHLVMGLTNSAVLVASVLRNLIRRFWGWSVKRQLIHPGGPTISIRVEPRVGVCPRTGTSAERVVP